jgi:uncharacterized protein
MQEIEFLKFVVENLVNHKEDIKIEKKDDELWTLLTLSVNKEDMGMIIWKGGSTINALRSILRLLGLKLNRKINLKVLD